LSWLVIIIIIVVVVVVIFKCLTLTHRFNAYPVTSWLQCLICSTWDKSYTYHIHHFILRLSIPT